MESPVDKSFGEGMQDTSMIKPAMGWFGMPPHSAQNSVGEGMSRLHVDRDACKGSTDTPIGATLRATETPEPPSFNEESMSVR